MPRRYPHVHRAASPTEEAEDESERGKGAKGSRESADDAPPVDPTLVALAATKSYTGSAIIVFFLYLLFWLPGLIFNLVYLNDAKRMERLAGTSLPGVGCLTVMIWVNIIGLALLIALGYILLR